MTHTFVGTDVTVQFEALPRERLDELRILFPEPEPPTREVEAFGEPERVYDLTAPEYQLAYMQYGVQIQHALLALLEDYGNLRITAHTIHDDHDEIVALGLHPMLVALGGDYAEFMDDVYYRSTVTARGMEEAAHVFGVTWLGQPVSMFGGNARAKSPLGFSQVFFDRMAAHTCGYNWTEFCLLTGPAQSACVVFHYYYLKIQHLRH